MHLKALLLRLLTEPRRATRSVPIGALPDSDEEEEMDLMPAPEKTPHVRDLLHLKWSDQLPLVFKFAGRTFVWQSGSPPSYMVCCTKEDQDARRAEVLKYDFGAKEGDR